MSLFKSGKAKADDLLTILIPALEFELREEIRRRLLAQMEETVQVVAQRVIGYGYDQAIKELTIKVSNPKLKWEGLTDGEIVDCWSNPVKGLEFTKRGIYQAIETKLREKNEL